MPPSSPRSSRPRLALAAGLLALVAAAGACGSSSNGAEQAAGTTTSSSLPPYIPVGTVASESSKMVCGTEGQAVIAAALNETPTKVSTPTWTGHVYSCTYIYGTATMGVAVKELSTEAETTAYFDALKKQYGVRETFELAEGAFISQHDVVVARKDYKVLVVDPTHLPAQFGQPPTTLDNVSVQTAVALMGCWTGA